MKRKFKLKNNFKFYGIISLTFMLLIALGFMGVRDYDGRKNDVVNDNNQVAINNNRQNFGDGSGYAPGGTQGTKRTTTTKKKTTTKKTTSLKTQIGYFTCVNCTVTSCSGSCSYVSGGTSAACYSMDCIVSAKARDGYSFSNGSTISSTRISKTSGGSLAASKSTTKPAGSGSTSVGKVTVAGGHAILTCTGCASLSNTTATCKTSACGVSIKLESGYGLMDSSKVCVGGTYYHNIDSKTNISYTTCKLSGNSGSTNTTTSTTSTKRNGGGGTPAQPTTQPKTEPKPGNNSTTTVNKWVWAKGPEYQGETIACGDKLYITTCTNDNDPICNVTNINGKEVKNTKIRRSNYTENEADTGCFQNIKRYVKEKTFSYTNSGMTEGKTEIDCGSIVVFTKSIDSSCSNGVCEVTYNGKKIYLREDMKTDLYKEIDNFMNWLKTNDLYELFCEKWESKY